MPIITITLGTVAIAVAKVAGTVLLTGGTIVAANELGKIEQRKMYKKSLEDQETFYRRQTADQNKMIEAQKKEYDEYRAQDMAAAKEQSDEIIRQTTRQKSLYGNEASVDTSRNRRKQ